MFHFLGFLLLLILAVLLVGFVIVLTFVRRLMGLGKSKKQSSTYYYNTTRNRGTASNARSNFADDGTVAVEEGELHINRKKIFGKDEGEYVSYEEVKE